MVTVAAGCFLMGSETGDADERPVHRVFIDGYRIGKYVVTQAMWKRTMGQLPCKIRQVDAQLPIVEISWYDAIEFCNRLSYQHALNSCYSSTGGNVTCDFDADGFRLPTESEWEYAARGGAESNDYLYAGSHIPDEVAWYVRNSSRQLHQVGQKKPNGLGLYDMSGNVYEYCWDPYGPYPTTEVRNPTGYQQKVVKAHRVIRGGNSFGLPYRIRVSSRRRYGYMGYTHDFIGFRIVKRVVEKPSR